jgi:hypothetical protein
LKDAHRQPVWSDKLTLPIAARLPRRRRPAAIRAVKAVHTAAFALIAGCIVLFTWDAIRGRSGRRAIVAATIAVTETLVYASNNQVCPLTPLAEELGAESGTVTDLYLPRPISDRIPVIGGSTLLIGVAFHLLGWWQRRSISRRR